MIASIHKRNEYNTDHLNDDDIKWIDKIKDKGKHHGTPLRK